MPSSLPLDPPRRAELPPQVVWAVIGLCLLPSLLNWLGWDFGMTEQALLPGGLEQAGPSFAANPEAQGLHTFLEYGSFFTTLFTGILAGVYYKITRDVTSPIIGLALLAAGLTNIFHSLGAENIFFKPQDLEHFAPFTWLLSRIYHVTLIILGLILVVRFPRLVKKITERILIIGSFFLFLLSFSSVYFASLAPDLPNLTFPGHFLERPFDFLPLALVVLLGIPLAWKLHKQSPTYFSHALLLMMIPELFTQGHVSLGSQVPFDNHFNIAHLTEILSYGVPFVGILFDYYFAHKDRETALGRLLETQKGLEETVQSRTAELSDANVYLMAEVGRRENTEAKLRDSEARYRLLFEESRFVKLLLHPETGMILEANPAALAFYGYSRDQLMGKRCRDLNPDGRDFCLMALCPGEQEGQKTFQCRHILASGEARNVEIHSSFVNLQGDHLLFCIIDDITEQKQIEEKIKINIEQQAAINAIQKIALEAVPLHEQLGRVLDEVVAVPWLHLTPKGAFFLTGPDSQRLHLVAEKNMPEGLKHLCSQVEFDECLCGLAAVRKELIFCDHLTGQHTRHYDGMENHGHYIVPILANNQALGVLCIYVAEGHESHSRDVVFLQTIANIVANIIERRKAETALRESEFRNRTILEAIPNLTFRVNDKHLFRECKATDAQAWYHLPERLPGRNIEEIFPPATSKVFAEHLEESLRNQATVMFQFALEVKGLFKNFEVRLIPYGRQEVLGVVNDITEHKHAEREQERLQKELRRKETMFALGHLVAGVAHEVRNPIFSIVATLDAFEARFGKEHQFQRYFTILRKEQKRLTTLMEELLEYGKPYTKEYVPGPLEEVIVQALRAVGGSAEEYGVSLEMDFPEGGTTVRMAPERLFQVFQNLFQNALQHTLQGGNITVEVHQVLREEQPWVECLIKDTGPGFQEEDLPRIFEPFFTRRRGGTGLGLSIAQRIVEDHQGEITLGNRPEGGALVTISLPCYEEEEQQVYPQISQVNTD